MPEVWPFRAAHGGRVPLPGLTQAHWPRAGVGDDLARLRKLRRTAPLVVTRSDYFCPSQLGGFSTLLLMAAALAAGWSLAYVFLRPTRVATCCRWRASAR